jgi:hypothetical protein
VFSILLIGAKKTKERKTSACTSVLEYENGQGSNACAGEKEA